MWEWEKPAAVVESYWENSENQRGKGIGKVLDPFGLVSWPGSVVAAQELKLHRDRVKSKCVLILGAGVGIEAQAAALLGAASVLATDIHPVTLQLLEYGAQQAGLGSLISTALFDIVSDEPLPACDLMIVADVLYNEKLAAQVARRCLEAQSSALVPPPAILITDSQRFVHDFEPDINAKMLSMGQPAGAALRWSTRDLPAFTGSGVMIDEDQTYDVHARIMWIGLDDNNNNNMESNKTKTSHVL